jgi:pheromone shutdown protein TraB
MERSIRAGILGSIVSVFITLFTPYYLYFLPSFFASIVAIYFLRLAEMRDCLLAAFMTYFVSSAVINAVAAALLYASGEPYTLVIDVSIVVSPLLDVVTAFLAAYIGVRVAQRAKPVPELPQTLKPLPPV